MNKIDNSYNIKLFNSVFENIVTKRIILYHLNIFNTFHSVNITFGSIEHWRQFKYKEYLNEVSFLWNSYYQDLQQTLPENIKNVKLNSVPPLQYINHVKSLLAHVESIEFYHFDYYEMKSPFVLLICSKINTLKLIYTEKDQIKPNTIPNSITNLKIENTYNQFILKNALPSNLQVLKLNYSNGDIFMNNSLPDSLTHLHLEQSKTPSSNFGSGFKDLKIKESQLPKSLKSLEFNFKYHVHKIKSIPKSIEYLSVKSNINTFRLKGVVYMDLKILPNHLKCLEIDIGNEISLSDKGRSFLPNTLKRLVINFNKVLLANQLPSSLTYLEFNELFDQVIDINVLPINLETLILNGYSKPINPIAIPKQLKLLQINNSTYRHRIQLTPSTHPYTAISSYNIELYYDPTNTHIRVLRLPDTSNYKSLYTYQLEDKSNLEYLHLGSEFNYSIDSSDLPIENNIKTLVTSNRFTQTINLEYFQNLETIIIQDYSFPKITTTTTIINDQQIQYNNYKLKNIIVSTHNQLFIKQLDINFYKFLKYKQTNIHK